MLEPLVIKGLNRKSAKLPVYLISFLVKTLIYFYKIDNEDEEEKIKLSIILLNIVNCPKIFIFTTFLDSDEKSHIGFVQVLVSM